MLHFTSSSHKNGAVELHSGYFMSEFQVSHTRLASYLCPSILQGHPRSLSKVGDTDGSCDPQAPHCLAVCCLLSASAGQAGSPSRPPTSVRPCLALPGLAPSDIRVIMASGDGGYRLGVRPHPLLFFPPALRFQDSLSSLSLGSFFRQLDITQCPCRRRSTHHSKVNCQHVWTEGSGL